MASKGSTQHEGAVFLAIEVVHLRLCLFQSLTQQRLSHVVHEPLQDPESLLSLL
jgi:hypothetical protein